MEKNILVSIIVPIYNAESTLKYCLDSILNQKYCNFEVLMVNDGSKDSSSVICKEYEKKDSRFIYLEKENGGVSSARNLAIKKSKGKYISFVDADDTININYISNAINSLIDTKSDIYISSFNFIHSHDSKNDYAINENCSNLMMTGEDYLLKLVDGSGIGSGCINKIYKKEIINKIMFEEVAVAEDLKFNVDVVKSNDNLRIVYSSSKLYNYYINNNSVMHGKFSLKNLDVLKQYNKLIKESEDFNKKFNLAMKLSLVFVSCKLIIKMVSSSYYDEKKYEECKENIDKYKKYVYRSSNYGIKKKAFLLFFNTFYKRIINSYNKNNLWKKLCNYINMEVG